METYKIITNAGTKHLIKAEDEMSAMGMLGTKARYTGVRSIEKQEA